MQQVVNETLRLGIGQTSKRTDAKRPFRVRSNKSGLAEGIDPFHLNRLIDEFEVEEFLAKQEGNISPSPRAMSLEDAYGSVKPSGKQAKAGETTDELGER